MAVTKAKKKPTERTCRLAAIAVTPAELEQIKAEAEAAGRTIKLEIRWRLFPPSQSK